MTNNVKSLKLKHKNECKELNSLFETHKISSERLYNELKVEYAKLEEKYTQNCVALNKYMHDFGIIENKCSDQ